MVESGFSVWFIRAGRRFDKKEIPGKFKESPARDGAKVPEHGERLFLENSTAC